METVVPLAPTLAATAVGLAALVAVGIGYGQPVLLAPFAATAAVVAITPVAPAARPRTIVLSYALASTVGALPALAGSASGTVPLALAALATLVAVTLMIRLRWLHVPSIAMPVLMAAHPSTTGSMAIPIALGSVTMALVALVNRWLVNRSLVNRPLVNRSSSHRHRPAPRKRREP